MEPFSVLLIRLFFSPSFSSMNILNVFQTFIRYFHSQILPQSKENRISSTSWHHLAYISMIIPISILPITPQNYNLCQSQYWKIKWFVCLFNHQWVRICFYMVTDICISVLNYFCNRILIFEFIWDFFFSNKDIKPSHMFFFFISCCFSSLLQYVVYILSLPGSQF